MTELLRWLRERHDLRHVPQVTQAMIQGLAREGRDQIEREARHLRRLMGCEE